MATKIKISSNFAINPVDYAIQANAILGIRDSGKTYTATLVAEQLFQCGIPFIAFDPVGVWKYLRVGKKGAKGLPIIVAGGDSSCDIKLTSDNAASIVRAAMKCGASLVIDLYSPALANKSTWIKIVKDCIHLLMYENKSYGLRHVFLEEAAEFIPQVVRSQHSLVYSEIEKLARMGRNAKLGMTIINQRAEEVNKAILEICEMSFLHKQVGRNSLSAINKWMEILSIEDRQNFIKQLPHLQKGSCIVVGAESNPILIHVNKKRTDHPSPNKGSLTVPKLDNGTNLKSIMNMMTNFLEGDTKTSKKEKSLPISSSTIKSIDATDYKLLYKNTLEKQRLLISRRNKDVQRISSILEQMKKLIESIASSDIFKPVEIPAIQDQPKVIQPAKTSNSISSSINLSEKNGEMRILKAVAMYEGDPVSMPVVSAIASMSHTSGTFNEYYRRLKAAGLIEDVGIVNGYKQIRITNSGIDKAGEVPKRPTTNAEILDMWCSILGSGSGKSKILRVLVDHLPGEMDINELSQSVDMSAKSGTFNEYQRQLKKLGLIVKSGNIFKASEAVFSN